ncbi:MAG: DUF1592 domain-containing protein [Planctomycetaceae bacterium]|nr:DUF1592 domain-containing protein [Planctomycetaceae bacterium]
MTTTQLKLVQTLLIALWIPGLFVGITLMCSPAAKAAVQEEKDERDREEVEEEDFEEEDEEEGFEEEDGQLEELLEIREHLVFDLKELESTATRLKKRIAMIDEFVATVKKRVSIERQVEQAEDDGNVARVEKLDLELERLEIEIESREQIMEAEYELVEVEEGLREAREEDDEERIDLLERLSEGLLEVQEITKKLMPIYLKGPESAEGPLEQERAKIQTKLEKVFRSFQVLEELREAEEEEDEARIDELEEKLQELRRGIDERQEDSPQEEKGDANASVEILAPIVVNEQALAPYVNANIQRDVAPLLRKYCVDCHGNDSSSGELNLEALLTESPIVKSREKWINVIEQTKNHVMPTEDGLQPDLKDRKTIVLALHHAIHNFDYSDIRDPGFEATRRLTHREYSHTVRDLFGIEIDVVDRFPDDLTATSGFDNSANSLFIQPLLMERYIGIAESVVMAALPLEIESAEQKATRKRFFHTQPSSPAEAKKAATELFGKFLLRAFRRLPKPEEVQRYVQPIVAAVQSGTDYESAVRASLQTVLISPSFLLLSESVRAAESEPYRADDWEIASRLSYFLWASMPDDELFKLAAVGRLRDTAVLKQQVARMIADPRANTLGSVFASQWLGSQHLGVRMRLDPIDNPWCTESLMAAMRDETSMFFNYLVRQNRPISELVNADYTFLNQELAKLYNIRGVKGPQMRWVKLEDTKRRGGIFGQGSLLAVTSVPHRTSPVSRGHWILDNVLGTPPPPPPPNVSEFPEEIEENRSLSFREKLELHRSKPNCYACHSQMDPLGFSLEQYDWFGRYRTRRGQRRIDPTGRLPNGTEFQGLAGLKQVIVEQRRDDLVRQMSQKMLSYALGRQLEYYDEPAIRTIVAKVMAENDQMQTLLQEVVLSYPFQYKMNRPNHVATTEKP